MQLLHKILWSNKGKTHSYMWRILLSTNIIDGNFRKGTVRTIRNPEAEAAPVTSPGNRWLTGNFFHPKLSKSPSSSGSGDANQQLPSSKGSANNSSGSNSSDKVAHRRSLSLSTNHHRAASLDSGMYATTTVESSSSPSAKSTPKTVDELAIPSATQLKSIKSYSQFINPNIRIDEDDNSIAMEIDRVNPMAVKVCLAFFRCKKNRNSFKYTMALLIYSRPRGIRHLW